LNLVHRLRRLTLLFTACFVSGCTVALGPGYTIVKQEINVHFVPAPQPLIRITAVYQLRNTGNQPLPSLELRLPGRRRFHFADPHAEWDQSSLAFAPSTDNPRNVLLIFPQPWTVSARHTLRLSVLYQPAASNETALSFAPDAFFLPAQGWSPELVPARGILATGGVPPKSWNLFVQIPADFQLHISGHGKRSSKVSRGSGEQTVRVAQTAMDGYPFVIAGRYVTAALAAGKENVNLWTRAPQNPESLRQSSEALVRAIQAYDSTFGNRSQDSHQLWIVECPVVAGCFTSTTSNYAKLIAEENEKPSAEMASANTAVVDLAAGTPEIAAAAPSLAASWLGYGQNPGFFEQDPPLSALPAFAAARGLEAVEGPQLRTETIARLLRAIPEKSAPNQPESDQVVRAKSILFFYALQDRYGPQVFSTALRHMLEARRGGGFDLNDLIASFEAEAHQNIAEFVRLWMKHPGVPQDFRDRYRNSAASARTLKENTP
jgi:hypothetical protein